MRFACMSSQAHGLAHLMGMHGVLTRPGAVDRPRVMALLCDQIARMQARGVRPADLTPGGGCEGPG